MKKRGLCFLVVLMVMLFSSCSSPKDVYEVETDRINQLVRDITKANKNGEIKKITTLYNDITDPELIDDWVDYLNKMELSAVPFERYYGAPYCLTFTTDTDTFVVGNMLGDFIQPPVEKDSKTDSDPFEEPTCLIRVNNYDKLREEEQDLCHRSGLPE